MNAIETRALTKCYGRLKALDGVNLRVPAGSIFGFLGPNGAGKTTVIRILMGLLKPTGGEAKIFGLDSRRESVEIRRAVGYLPGDLRLYEWMTGRRFLTFCDRVRGAASGAELERLAWRLEMNLDRRIRDCSRGMKQKIGLMQALMHRPRLLILDEPTTALDPLVQQVLYEELRSAATEGRTVLFSSHTLSEVELLCDQVAIIRGGRLVEQSSIESLKARAVRHVRVILRREMASGTSFPTELVIGDQRDGVLNATHTGDMNGLLRWLAQQDVEEVSIAEPSLDDLFAAYYREERTTTA